MSRKVIRMPGANLQPVSLLKRIIGTGVGAVAMPAVMDYSMHGGPWKGEWDHNRKDDTFWNTLFGALGGYQGAKTRSVMPWGTSLLLSPGKQWMRSSNRTEEMKQKLMPDLASKLTGALDANSGWKKYAPVAAGTAATLLGALALHRIAGGVNRGVDNKAGGRVQMRLPARDKNDTEAVVDVPINDVNVSPTLLRGIGTDTRRKLRREVESRVHRRDEDGMDEYKYACEVIVKMAATAKGVGGGFLPLEMPRASGATAQPLETTQNAQANGGDETQTAAGPIAANKEAQQQQAMQQAELQRMQLENMKMTHEMRQTPEAPASGNSNFDTAFSSGVLSRAVDDLKKRVKSTLKVAALFDRFKQWDDNAGLVSGNTAASLLPGVGNVMSGMRAANAFSEGNIGGGIFHSIGAIPVVGNMVTGVGGKLFNFGKKAIDRFSKAGGMVNKGLHTVAGGVQNAGNMLKPMLQATSVRAWPVYPRLFGALAGGNGDAAEPQQEQPVYTPPIMEDEYSLLPKTANSRYTPDAHGKIDIKNNPEWDTLVSQHGNSAAQALNQYGQLSGIQLRPDYVPEPDATSTVGRWIQTGLKALPNIPLPIFGNIRENIMRGMPDYSRPSEFLPDARSNAPTSAFTSDQMSQLSELLKAYRN